MVHLSVCGCSVFLPVLLVLIVFYSSVLFVFHVCVSPDLVSHLCSTGTFQLWGQSIQVDWAEPEKDVEEEVMQRVRVLYVSEFMTEMTAEDPSS